MRLHRQRRPVLVLSKVRAGGHLYYLEATDERNGPGAEPPGVWLVPGGTMALDGEVDAREIEHLLQGRHPSSGEELGADRRRLTVAGYDLTFCAPKSVSLLHALAEPEIAEHVRVGHHKAVTAALSYVESRALAVRREVPGTGRVPVTVDPVPAAGFLHRTSRALDPHLHTHVLVANVGRGPGGEWSALDGRGVYAHRATVDALYHAQLRHELTVSLGVDWEPTRRGRADVAGVGERARQAFSARSAQIAAGLAEYGFASEGASLVPRRASDVASLATRPPKDLSVAVDDLRVEWRRRAREIGFGPLQLEAVLGRVPAWALDASTVDTGALASVLEEISAPGTGTSFSRRHVVRAWAGACRYGEGVRAVEEGVDRFLGSDAVVEAASSRGVVSDGPGVAERRHALAERCLGRGGERLAGELAERRLLERVLARRGMSLPDERSLALGRDRGLGLDR